MGKIFSIEEFSTFDGPGIRMTIFLKGCPLSCTWCHNPEGQHFEVEYLRSPNGCLDCGACLRAGYEETGKLSLSPKSISACPRNLVRCASWDSTPENLARKILKNATVLSMNGGGVTFSGGEPLSQIDFLCACLTLLEGKVHRALQTSGFAPTADFARALSLTDYVLFDLKIMDPKLHEKFCGADNRLIHENYRTLVQSGKPFVTRVPLIPTVTDTSENLEAIAAFVSSLGVRYVEVLPYNQLAGSKYAGLLRQYTPGFTADRPSCTGEEIFARYGITAKKM